MRLSIGPFGGSVVSRTLCRALVVVAGVSAGSSASGSVVQAGSFELPDLGDARVYRIVNESLVPGWTINDRGIEIWANGFNNVTSFDGTQHIELNVNFGATISQTISGVAAGQRLALSFAHRARSGTDVMRVLLEDLGADSGQDGDDTVLIDRMVSATTASWIFHEGRDNGFATSLGGDLRLSFTAVSTGSGRASVGNFVDAVALDVAPVPLPAAGSMLVLGVAGLALLRRRRRSSDLA